MHKWVQMKRTSANLFFVSVEDKYQQSPYGKSTKTVSGQFKPGNAVIQTKRKNIFAVSFCPSLVREFCSFTRPTGTSLS